MRLAQQQNVVITGDRHDGDSAGMFDHLAGRDSATRKLNAVDADVDPGAVEAALR